MDFKVRLMKMDRLISEKGVVTFEELQRATGAAPATVKRDIRYMREELKAPITFSRSRGGYLFAKNRAEAKREDFYERKSMWFTPGRLTREKAVLLLLLLLLNFCRKIIMYIFWGLDHLVMWQT